MRPAQAGASPGADGYRTGIWVLSVVGGAGTMLGAFILFGPAAASVSVGGYVSWRVGDLGAGWGAGLLATGVLALLAVAGLARRRRQAGGPAPQLRAALGADVFVHTAVFVGANAALWLQDVVVLGGGVDYAHWVTMPWAAGLAAHGLARYLALGSRTGSARAAGRPDARARRQALRAAATPPAAAVPPPAAARARDRVGRRVR